MTTYTTRLLTDLDRQPSLRRLAAGAVITIVLSAIGLTMQLRSPATDLPARVPPPITILATATPLPPPPTVTPAPAPDVRELASGAIVAWDGSAWVVLREPPAPAAAPADTHQASYQPEAPQEWHAPMSAPAAQPAPAAWHPPLVLPDAPQEWHPPLVLPDTACRWHPPLALDACE